MLACTPWSVWHVIGKIDGVVAKDSIRPLVVTTIVVGLALVGLADRLKRVLLDLA